MMDNKWFCRQRLLPVTSSFLLLLVVGLLCGRTAGAVDVPTWMRQAAAEPLPPVTAETVAVILYDEQETTVQKNGEVETTYRRAYMILRPGGKDLGLVRVPFDNETKITWIKAWCIPKNGKEYELKDKDSFESGYTREFYTDLRVKVMEIPASLPGNVIGYEYHQKQRPFFLQDEWGFQSTLPMHRSRFTLNLPPGWEHSSKWIHYPEQKALADTQSQVMWEVVNVPPIKPEPMMPDWRAIAGRMGVTFHPPSGTTSALGPTNWDQIGVWLSTLASGSFQSTPDIQQKVKELTANSTTWRDKVQVLGAYVQSRIRYIDIEIGIGGFQPHPAGDTYRHQYGDCKDKATLLSAMLKEAGIPSYLALAQTERGVIVPDFASAITFNHAILAIPLPADASVEGFSAVVDTSKFGKMLIFDPTSEYTPFGTLPFYEQENYILVSTPQGGELVHLPLSDPGANRLVRTAKLELHSDGSLSGNVVETRLGNEATSEREMLLHSDSTDRTKQLEAFLGNFLRGFHLTSASAENVDKVGEPLEVRYEFTAERYAKSAGDLLVIRPRVLGEKSSDVAEGDDPRKLPVEYEDTSMQTDDFEITLPPGYTVDDLPRPTKAETEFASYISQTQVTGNKIHYTRTYQVKKIIVPLDQIEALRKFNRQISSDEHANVVLKRAGQ
ncbi:MAG TPA: DUF3857 and transglutaminase domain-containing protein [Candidatus Acidoferrum sp.]|nr:DUF3857 and transglutaminase domain-containing protein [Candidatus Acidoferrum sp.]